MMPKANSNILDQDLLSAVLEGVPVGITVVDLNGMILYFNAHAARILDRKPEYLGTDIRRYHHNPESNAKIDRLLEEFAAGQRTQFSYRANRYGKILRVVFTPLLVARQVAGVIQTVVEAQSEAPST